MEQDARIEAENNFRSEQQLAKDRRIREQKAYRDFLFVQMNERKAREGHKVPFIYYVIKHNWWVGWFRKWQFLLSTGQKISSLAFRYCP